MVVQETIMLHSMTYQATTPIRSKLSEPFMTIEYPTIARSAIGATTSILH